MDFLGFDKILYHPEKLLKLQRNEPQFPVLVTLSLGNYCNHQCRWCTAYEYQLSKAKLIDFDQILGWLTQAKARGLKAVGYVGNGEPTAYPKFRELVTAIHDLGLQQGMFTNGLLLNRFEQEVLDFFTYVRISLDAGSASMHSRMHVVNESQYGRIIDNLATIVKKRRNRLPTIGVQFATHHQNISDLEPSCRTALEIGVDYFSVKPVFNRGSVGEKIEKNTLTFEQLTPVVADLRKKFERRDFSIFYRPHQVMSEEANRNTLKYDRCVAGFFNLNVYEDGKIVYCGPNRVGVGTIDDDLETIEERVLKLSTKLNLARCPAGCRYHSLNHLVDTVVNPERAEQYHVNFV